MTLPPANRLADAVVSLGHLALRLGRVDRITYHEDGATPESDTDHTVMLGLLACALAFRVDPPLNVGLVAEYALVHDLVEVYAGDTPTLRELSPDAKAAKRRREHDALQRLDAEFAGTLPWLPARIALYEAQAPHDREARFVKALDKILPKITHILNDSTTLREQEMSPADLKARYDRQRDELLAYAADFPELMGLRDTLADLVHDLYERSLR